MIKSNDTNNNPMIHFLLNSNKDLKPFESDFDFVDLLQTILKVLKEKERNSDIINTSITALRRLLKYEKKCFEILFESIKEYIAFFFEAAFDSKLAVNTLLLLYETIFTSDQLNCNWMINLFPSLIEISIYGIKAHHESEAIKMISNTIMEKISDCYYTMNIFQEFVLVMNDVDINISRKAMHFLYDIIVRLKSKMQIELIEWNILFKQCIKVFYNSDQNYQEALYSFLIRIKRIFSNDEWNNVIYSLEYQQLLSLLLILCSHNTITKLKSKA